MIKKRKTMIMMIMIWCFTSLSTLFKSYQDEGRLIMKGSVCRIQQDSNLKLLAPSWALCKDLPYSQSLSWILPQAQFKLKTLWSKVESANHSVKLSLIKKWKWQAYLANSRQTTVSLYFQLWLHLQHVAIYITTSLLKLSPFFLTLRKHAYSNIQKILSPKNENFQIKFFWYSSYFCSKHRLWVIVRNASMRRF